MVCYSTTQWHLLVTNLPFKFLYLLSNSGNQSYNLQPHLIATSKELEKDASGSHKKYNCHILTFHVSRRTGYYFWNVFFVTVSIIQTNQTYTRKSMFVSYCRNTSSHSKKRIIPQERLKHKNVLLRDCKRRTARIKTNQTLVLSRG